MIKLLKFEFNNLKLDICKFLVFINYEKNF